MCFFGRNSYFNRPSSLPSFSPLPLLLLFESGGMTDTLLPPIQWMAELVQPNDLVYHAEL